MPRLHVAYDTNVYRSISQSRFVELRRLERNHSVTGAASYWVAAELLSHLASPSDTSFRAALAGLRRLVEHCRHYNGSQYVLPFLGDVDSQVAYNVFANRLPDDPQSAYLAGLCGAVYESDSGELEEYRAAIIEISEEVSAAEQAFVENIWQNIILALIPGATGWSDLGRNKERQQVGLDELRSSEAERITATLLVSRVAKKIGRTLSAQEQEARITEILQLLTPAIRLQNAVLSHILRTSLDLRKGKHSNTLWDIQIAFAASTFARLGRTPLWLITNDKVVLSAAQEAGMDWSVHSLDNYVHALQQPSVIVKPK